MRRQIMTIHEQTFRALLSSLGLVRQVREPYLARFGISGSQWGVLRVLHQAESEGKHGLRLTDLGGRLFIQPPSVTAVVDRLERHGLVTRNGSSADLRVRLVHLTAEGRQLVEKLLVEHPDRIQSLFASLTAKELAQLLALLTKLESHLKTLVPGQLNGAPKHGKSSEM